jgi:hypothetical protein
VKRLLLVLAAVALVWSASAAGSSAPLPAPKGLHAFVYRADERVAPDHTYALMPAFAWSAVQGARMYDLQLATSKTFSDATTIYRNEYQAPVASIQVQVPWMTGQPYALWVRVRVHAGSRTSGWSRPFGFNTAWQAVPQQEGAPEGLLRWTPVAGATGYEVWVVNALGLSMHFSTLTNVADEREYWTFHPQDAGTIRWRVRAVRVVNSPGTLPNGIPVVTHGPYSPVYTTTTSAQIHGGRITPIEAVSDTASTPSSVHPHQLTPGFAWTGDTDVLGDRSSLWRVYVFSDRGCVNPVLTGSVVGGQAWAPRDIDPLTLPADTQALAVASGGKFTGWGAQSKSFAADEEAVTASESTQVGSSASTGGTQNTAAADRAVSLADNGWPQGRYWWTVVPVAIVQVPTASSSNASSGKNSKPAAIPLEYHDMALPQDLCAAGAVWPFGVQLADHDHDADAVRVRRREGEPRRVGRVAHAELPGAAGRHVEAGDDRGHLRGAAVAEQVPVEPRAIAHVGRAVRGAAAHAQGRRRLVLPRARREPGSHRAGPEARVVETGRDPNQRRPLRRRQVASAA